MTQGKGAPLGETFLGQDWDWNPHLKERTLLSEIEQTGQPNAVTLTEAGIAGKIGLNSANLGACLNILKSAVGPVDVSIHVLLRSIWNCGGFGEANRKMTSIVRGSCNNGLIWQSHGMATDFEIAPEALEFLIMKLARKEVYIAEGSSCGKCVSNFKS